MQRWFLFVFIKANFPLYNYILETCCMAMVFWEVKFHKEVRYPNQPTLKPCNSLPKNHEKVLKQTKTTKNAPKTLLSNPTSRLATKSHNTTSSPKALHRQNTTGAPRGRESSARQGAWGVILSSSVLHMQKPSIAHTPNDVCKLGFCKNTNEYKIWVF